MALGECLLESSPETEKFLCERLLDETQPISERFRVLFSLRNLRGPGPRHALILATRDSSNLLAHEAAFALGQMQDAEAVPALELALKDLSLHPIVRHEAAEALGAIGLEGNLALLENSSVSDPAPEVRETCELALKRIAQQHKSVNHDTAVSPFLSVDPAAPASSCASVEDLREVLLDEKKGMYQRYAALFALRNRGGDAAVTAIIDSLRAGSALLRHEVAYVLGQLQNKDASAALAEVLKDVSEHPMVRHEAAEALGSIADSQSIELLEEFVRDPEPIVSQSCEVALSMLEFERSGKSFEYLFMQTPQSSHLDTIDPDGPSLPRLKALNEQRKEWQKKHTENLAMPDMRMELLLDSKNTHHAKKSLWDEEASIDVAVYLKANLRESRNKIVCMETKVILDKYNILEIDLNVVEYYKSLQKVAMKKQAASEPFHNE